MVRMRGARLQGWSARRNVPEAPVHELPMRETEIE